MIVKRSVVAFAVAVDKPAARRAHRVADLRARSGLSLSVAGAVAITSQTVMALTVVWWKGSVVCTPEWRGRRRTPDGSPSLVCKTGNSSAASERSRRNAIDASVSKLGAGHFDAAPRKPKLHPLPPREHVWHRFNSEQCASRQSAPITLMMRKFWIQRAREAP